MIVWDTGVWAPMDDVEKSLRTGAFKFRLAGEKLNGGWMLARLKPKPGEDSKKQLAAVQGARPRRRRRRSTSSTRGRKASNPAGGSRNWSRSRSRRPDPAALKPGALPGAVQGAGRRRGSSRSLPRRRPIRRTATAPERLAARDQVRRLPHHGACLGRRGAADHPQRPRLDEALRRPAGGLPPLPCREAIIDGEIVVLDEKGISRFALLQDALSDGRRQQAGLLRLRPALSRRLGSLPRRRSKSARRCCRNCWPAHVSGRSAIQLSDHVAGDGQGALRAGVGAGARRDRLEARLGALPERPLEDLDQDQGAATSATSSSPATPRRRPPKGSPRWRSANGWTANCSIAARSAPASTPQRCAHLLDAAGAAAGGRDQARRRARRT